MIQSVARSESSSLFGLFLALLVSAAVIAPSVQADTGGDSIGFSPNHVFDGAIQGENVDIMTGNLSIRIPIGQRYQLNDWFGYQLELYYNSRIWKHDCDPTPGASCDGELVGTSAFGQGFDMHFGRIYREPADVEGIYRLQMPDGSERFFCSEGTECNTTLGLTLDSERMSVTRPAGAVEWEVIPGDGTRLQFGHLASPEPNWGNQAERDAAELAGWYVTRIETLASYLDAQQQPQPQQFVDIEYPDLVAAALECDDGATGSYGTICSVNDSANRTIDFVWGVNPTRIELPSQAGSTAIYSFNYSSATIDDPSDNGNTKIVSQLTSIGLPGVAEQYTFASYDDYGSLIEWALPTGATVRYHYRTFASSPLRPYYRNLYYREIETQFEDDPQPETYHWTYTRFGDGVIREKEDAYALQEGGVTGSNPSIVKVIDPFNNLTVYRFHNTTYPSGACDLAGCIAEWDDGLLESIHTYAGLDENGALLQRIENYEHTYDGTWVQYRTTSSEANAHSVPLRVRQSSREVITPGNANHPMRVHRTASGDWTAPSCPARAALVEEFDGQELYRSTHSDYVSCGSGYSGAMNSVELRDAAGNVVSRTDAEYELNRVKCSVERADGAGVADLPSDCDTNSASLQLQAGDVAVLQSVDGVTGDPVSTTTRGFDVVSDSFVSNYTYGQGVMIDQSFQGMTWYGSNRTVDPDTGLVATSLDPNGIETKYFWDDIGRLTQIAPQTDEVPVDIDYVDLAETRVTQGNTAGSDFTESVYLYDDLGRLTLEARRNFGGDIDFRKTRYDIAGRVIEQSEWASALSVEDAEDVDDSLLDWTYTEYSIANPNVGTGEPASYSDPLGRVSRVTRPDGSFADTTYEGAARIVTVRGIQGSLGPLDATTVYENDAFGRLISVDAPTGGADATYEYDERDNLVFVELVDSTSGTPVEQQRRFGYDALNRLKYAFHPESGVTDYTEYDSRGNLLEYTDANMNEFVQTYDDAGRLLSKTVKVAGAEQTLVSNIYDVGTAAGSDQPGATLGKLTEQRSYEISGGQSQLVSTLRMGYDSGGSCPASLSPAIDTYKGLGGRLQWSVTQIEPWQEELKTEYCYNELGLPYGQLYPDVDGSGRTRTHTGNLYKNGHYWETHDLNRDVEYAVVTDYDPHGAVAEFLRGNGVRTTIIRDEMGRPLTFDVDKPASPYRRTLSEVFGCPGQPLDRCAEPWAGYAPQPYWPLEGQTYEYDGAGNIAAIGAQNSFFYDANNRLEGATLAPSAVYSMAYQYDGFGNMTQRNKTVNGSPTVTDFAVHVLTNRVGEDEFSGVNGSRYDRNGNLLEDDSQGFVIDEQNRLREVWKRSGNKLLGEYSYDASGYRVRARADGMEVFYLRDQAGQILSEFRRPMDSVDDPGWLRDHVYAVGQAVATLKNDVPPKVTDLTVDPLTITAYNIDLSWTEPDDDDLSSYHIQRTSDHPSEPPVFFIETAGTTTIQDDLTLVAGNEFTYTLTVYDAAGNQSATSELVVRPRDGVPPAIPTNVQVIVGDGRIDVTWDPVLDDDIAGYVVRRKRYPFPWKTFKIVKEPKLADFTVKNGSKYRYAVAAIDTADNGSAESALAPLAPDFAIPQHEYYPSRPLGLKVVPGVQADEMVVSWDPVADRDTIGYMIRRSTVAGIEGDYLCTSQPLPGETCMSPNAEDAHYVDDDVLPGTTYYYMVWTLGINSRVSTPSEQVGATARQTGMSEGPSGLVAAFEVDQQSDPDPPPTSTCAPGYEDDDVIQVALTWSGASGSSQTSGYRVYRAAGTAVDPNDLVFVAVGEVELGATYELNDTAVNDATYTYYVVYFDTSGESEASAPVSVVHSWDPLDSASSVRAIRAYDGTSMFTTENRRSRRVKLEWSRVPQPGIIGYNVYRRCEWSENYSSPWIAFSPHFRECSHQWQLLTPAPIQSDRTFVDNPGGIGGELLYAVRAVGPDGSESNVDRVLVVSTDPALGDGGEHCLELDQTDFFPQSLPAQLLMTVDDGSLEKSRINTAVRGTKDPATASAAPNPDPPTDVAILQWGDDAWGTFAHETITLRWSVLPADRESDLLGYHVEMAGADDGPWERITKKPIAWWESSYHVKAFDLILGGYAGTDLSDCARFRVIAVNQQGYESAPAVPADGLGGENQGYGLYPRGCSGPTTPEAPTGLIASDGAGVCSNLLTWTHVADADQYFVYRMRLSYIFGVLPSYYFYRTAELDGATACAGGTGSECTYEESGDDPGGLTTDVDTQCPWLPDDYCHSVGLEAYYVTAVGLTGGESPRSDIVLWDCNKTPGYARYQPENEHDLGEVFAWRTSDVFEPAESASGSNSAIQIGVCESVDVVEPRYATHQSPLLSPMATLGTSDPSYTITDIHVDHLGSTRMLTSGTLSSDPVTHSYLPFGEETVPIAQSRTKKMFTGHERDEQTGHDYMKARYYSHVQKRFVGVDPLIGSRYSPNSYNRYAYVRNTPTNRVDPTGMSDVSSPGRARRSSGCELGLSCFSVPDNLTPAQEDDLRRRLDILHKSLTPSFKQWYQATFRVQVDQLFEHGKGPRIVLSTNMKDQALYDFDSNIFWINLGKLGGQGDFEKKMIHEIGHYGEDTFRSRGWLDQGEPAYDVRTAAGIQILFKGQMDVYFDDGPYGYLAQFYQFRKVD